MYSPYDLYLYIASLSPDERQGSPGPAAYDQSKMKAVKDKNPEWT